MTDDETYPSLREALFGNDHPANLYCGIKWITWQVAFAFLAVIFAAVAVFVVVLTALWSVGTLAYYAVAARVPVRVTRLSTRLPDAPPEGVTADKPVLRRVYNYCPVDFSVNPRWFERGEERVKAVVEWLEPPEYVWMCEHRREGDFSPRRMEPANDTCPGCGSEYEKVREDKL